MRLEDKVRDYLEFGAVLAREFPAAPDHFIARDARLLIYLARKHQRFAETECNRELTARETRDYHQVREHGLPRVMGRLMGASDANPNIETVGRTALILGGDPRGCTVKLKLGSGKTNDFGREGWCVPL